MNYNDFDDGCEESTFSHVLILAGAALLAWLGLFC